MTHRIICAVMIVAVVVALSGCAFASEASVAVNDFAFNAGKIIMANSGGDFFFSPYSIISAFGMAYAGARGDTAKEIESALGVNQGIHDSLGGLARDLDRSGYVSSANRVWVKSGLTLLKDYTDILSLNYDSKIKQLDMKHKTEESRKMINDWVSEKTHGRIQNLLQSLDPETRMVITNAVYFSAEWENKFSKSATKPEKFDTGNGKYVDVPMMKQRRDYMYCELDGMKAIMLPYKGRRLSMVAVLPPEGDPDALKDIDSAMLERLRDSMTVYDVDLWLPKFKNENKYELKYIFEALGVKLAFTNDADFSGMTSDEPLRADAVIHQTFINIDEERTEAAAATAIPMMLGSAMPVKKPFAVFHADRPFMYFIVDNESGSVLFMGYQSFRD